MEEIHGPVEGLLVGESVDVQVVEKASGDGTVTPALTAGGSCGSRLHLFSDQSCDGGLSAWPHPLWHL